MQPALDYGPMVIAMGVVAFIMIAFFAYGFICDCNVTDKQVKEDNDRLREILRRL